MKWSHRGVLLEAPPALPWAASHAALPHFDVRDGRTELYFTTRDANGRSHIARGAVDLDGGNVELDPEPVLAPGPLGRYDDSGVTASSLAEHDGKRYLYFTGWSLGRTVPFYLFGGCAVSDDGGATFRPVSAGPILERNDVDPYMTLSPWVLHDEGRFRMWYVSCTEWRLRDGEPQHRYHVRYAESDDGVAWRRDGVVCIDYRDDDEYAIARPCVIRDGDTYRMWFSARGDRYELGYAESADGILWTRFEDVPGFVPSGDWDSDMQEYPVVHDDNGRRWLAYNGNDYGRTGIGYAELT